MRQEHPFLCTHVHRVCIMDFFSPAVFLTPFSLQLVAFCCNLQLLQSWSVKQSTEREMKSFSCLPETHCAHKQSSLPFKISQNLFKPRKSTQKNTHIQKPLLSQGFSFMAVSKSWDLKQHPVKALKIYSCEFRFSFATQWKTTFFTHSISYISSQICLYMPSYKLTSQTLMRPRLCRVWWRSHLFFRPPAHSRCSP